MQLVRFVSRGATYPWLQGHTDEALGHFLDAQHLDPTYAPARMYAGVALMKLGSIKEGVEYCAALLIIQVLLNWPLL